MIDEIGRLVSNVTEGKKSIAFVFVLEKPIGKMFENNIIHYSDFSVRPSL